MDCGAGSSQNWGKSNVGLEGYFDRRNARIDPQAEYNDIDRKWRKKYLASQHLSANDNKIDLYRNADYKKWRYNIFRRIWRAPLDFVEFNVISKIYPDWTQARGVRHAISVFLGAWAIGVMGAYYGKYASDDWARVRVTTSDKLSTESFAEVT